MNDITINIYVLIIISMLLLPISICLFLTGYCLGKMNSSAGVWNVNPDKNPKGFFDQQKSSTEGKNIISIDNSKFVTDLKTDTLEKKYHSLGEIQESEENISDSINKLKNLKR